MKRPGPNPELRTLAAGDARAFEQLYDQFAARLYRAAWGMLGRAEDAEDAVQDVFTAIVRSREQLVGVDDMTAYLFTALRHAAGKIGSRRAKEPNTASMPADQVVDARSFTPPTDPRSERLERALRALSPAQREVITLKIDGQLTFEQIAQVMKIGANTAASRYRYALEKLRASLGGTS